MSITIPPEKAALHRAARILGGQAALASVLGYSDRRNVAPWFTTGRRLPAEHAPAIERATLAKGDVVACESLCPWVDWGVLRDRRQNGMFAIPAGDRECDPGGNLSNTRQER